ncbi:putative UvrABC system protein C [endosymbiont DhMRE of Dentiscutata heterogama]|uniref:excinuclease ABC subunit UvrC n=1 Tax=endosymbiont DhMRE of Dentiscutata heterogama TaxID=1609546 RepID=UPI000629D47E|nr:excinuclease ABC subunit UvrC [endosymbiont DhMRE of Dentiscutata heterogama]CFW92753.1 putative UvrABC system protein C [endosymbiont DhMRE of Dentiscutata heterogama]
MLPEPKNKSLFPKIIAKIPPQPGCYLFRDKTGTIIYVGKAQNLKKRISSYFLNSRDNYFYQQIHSFNTIITNNVKEALILEQNLIKKYQPRFNVLLKDSHYYPYLEITAGENPRYRVVRKVTKKNDPINPSEYFGPFPDGSKAREILQLLERLFPLAKCKGNLRKPCLYYTINQCSGHCWKLVDKSYYENIKKEVRKFFHGQTQEIKKKIKDSLRKNIVNLAFEIAQKEKKILDNIDFFTSQQNIEFLREENSDFLGVYEQENVIAFCLLIYRYGKLVATDEAAFPAWNNAAEITETYLYQFYQNNLPPAVLYTAKKIPEIKLLGEELGFVCKSPQRGRKKEVINLAQQNAQQVWQKNYLNEFQQVNKRQVLTEISSLLSIPPPNYIECLDISNLYKQDIVAGFLAFINGEKNLAQSKLYKLENEANKNSELAEPPTEATSDLTRIKKACRIHFQKYSSGKKPDLIIVDGGKEQVKAVQQILKELAFKIPVIGLAKDEKHQTAKIITNTLQELNFGQNERVKNFLTNCQAEVHRYALNFHRQLHRRSILKKS